MRCLQCGKALPLLKRLAGGEFCSDAHRKEYQQEYTNLALSRLQQAVAPTAPPRCAEPAEETAAVIVPPPATGAPPKQPAASKQEKTVPAPPPTTPARMPSASPAPAPSTQVQFAPTPVTSAPVAAAQLKRTPPIVPRPQPGSQPKAVPQKRDARPAMAGTLTRKPPAARIRKRRTVASLEVISSRNSPALPQRQYSQVATALATATAVNWAPVCELRGPVTAVMESKLDVRGFLRTSPVVDIAMSVISPQGWDFAIHVPKPSIPMVVPAAISPGEAVLWTAPPHRFSGSLKELGERVQPPAEPQEPPASVSLVQPVPKLDLGLSRSTSSKILTLFSGSKES